MEDVKETINVGSGDVNTRNNVNIEQGFQNAGIEVTTTAWLDRQEKKTRAAKEAYVQWMKEETARKHISEVAVMFDHPYKEPDCEIITTNDIDVSETDTAVYVIARNSGEPARSQTEINLRQPSCFLDDHAVRHENIPRKRSVAK